MTLRKKSPATRGGDEGDAEAAPKRCNAFARPAHEPLGARHEQGAIVDHHGENGAELNDDVEGLGPLAFRTEEVADQDEMPGRRHREVLGHAFDETEQRSKEVAHAITVQTLASRSLPAR